MFEIQATSEQTRLLSTPWVFSLDALMAADFVADQLYINWWILNWLKTNTVHLHQIPLCVSESIHCDAKLMKMYIRNIRSAIVNDNWEYLQKHTIIDVQLWNVVDFSLVTSRIFDLLWSKSPATLDLLPFAVKTQRLTMVATFVNQYGPTQCLRECVIQQWSEGVRLCLAEGAEIKGDCVGLAVRHPGIFRQLTECNPLTTVEHWKEFQLQRILKRIPDVPLTEEWFWINGFRE